MPPQIGLQLYSLRDALAEDFVGGMKRVADIGFTGIETAFFSENVTANEARRVFDDLGLTVLSSHCALPLGEAQDSVLALLHDLRSPRAVWHGWPEEERYRTTAGIAELADLYNEANAVCRSQGLTFGLHNHWWEFQPLGDQPALLRLRPLLEPDLFFELDTYWIQTAGQNPVAMIQEFGVRAPLLHLKDGPATTDDLMVPIGMGAMDTPAIVRAAQPTAEWLIVELDNVAGDPFDALAQSYRFLRQ